MMATFDWPVSMAGHSWVKSPTGSGELILTVNKPWPIEVQRPLDGEPGLFQAFAGLPIDQDACLKFANHYGHLGRFIWQRDHVFDPEHLKSTERLNLALAERLPGGLAGASRDAVETFDFWRSQIAAMNAAVRTWITVKQGDADPIQLRSVVTVINDRIAGRLVQRFHCDDAGTACVFETLPPDLITAMWCQFGHAIVDRSEFRRCSSCHRLFLVGQGKRFDQRHCSAACKQRAYLRKRKAIKLYQNGKLPREIAAALNVEEAMIEEWLKKARVPPRPMRHGKSVRALDV